MRPIDVNPDGTGYYVVDDAPEATADQRQSSKPERAPRPRRYTGMARARRIGKLVGYGTAAALVAAGAMQVKDWVEGFSPDATHKTDLTVGAPETRVYQNVHVDLATMESKFPIELHTSLDRPGPFNCDTETRHTGREGEDKKIVTTTDAGMVVDSLSVTKEDGRVRVVVDGDIHLSQTAVDYDENMLQVRGASGSVDVCVGTGEVTDALNILNRAIQHAGGIASACALDSPVGRSAFEEGIVSFVSSTELVAGSDPGDIDVELPSYDRSADAVYGAQVKEFRESVSGAIDEYLSETAQHEQPRINDQQLLDCSQHTIRAAQ